MFILICFFILCIGGINWFCIGVFQMDLIASIFGSQAHFISRFIYTIIGISGLIALISLPIKKGRIYTPKKAPKISPHKNSITNFSTTNSEKPKSNPNPAHIVPNIKSTQHLKPASPPNK